MEWIDSGHPDYDERRRLYNAMIDKRPRLIAACSTADDVRAALDRARRDGLAVAVRAGGHSVAGMSSNDDGLVIDVRPMRSIEVDESARRVKVGAGLTWSDFDKATQQHGLATTGGRVSTTGVCGLTIGGGSGWLERTYGLACDNLVGLDLVTADGREVHADATHEPDLLWASKGGGGNFGVITALEFQLHPVGPLVYAGLLVWDGARTSEIATAFRDWANAAPTELGPALVAFSAPAEDPFPQHLHDKPVVVVAALWLGDEDSGNDIVQPMRALGPDLDLLGMLPYAEFQCMIDDPPGNRHYWSADYHDALSDQALEVFVRGSAARPSPLTQNLLLPWGGAVATVGPEDSPMTMRDAAWVSHPFGVWERAEDDEVNMAWVRDFRRSIAPYTNGGTYLNFIGDEGQDRVRAAFGEEKYARLAAIKAEYDPDNVFSGNQNIRPAVPA